ncbi:MAG: sulfotransferase [Thermoleophilaceae bacterium]
MLLPNLFVIGAMKCGTSSLHHYLDQHPQVSMSSNKEPNVFLAPDWRQEVSRYAEMLDPDAAVRGESSTNYTKFPKFPDAPARIAGLVPDAKLIYVAGDPIQRTLAHYAQTVSDETESRSLDEAVSDFEDPENTYVWNGRYATQAERFLAHFPASSLLVLDQADLRSDRVGTMREVFRFLGVDDAFSSPEFESMLNTRRERRRVGSLGTRVRESRAAGVYRRIPARVRRPMTQTAHRVLSRPVERPALDDDLRARLVELYEPEIERLAELSGRRIRWAR